MRNGLFISKDENHRFQKKILIKAFSRTYLENYVPIFDKHAKHLMNVSFEFNFVVDLLEAGIR